MYYNDCFGTKETVGISSPDTMVSSLIEHMLVYTCDNKISSASYLYTDSCYIVTFTYFYLTSSKLDAIKFYFRK